MTRNPASINLGDQGVQKLLGLDRQPVLTADEKRKQLVQVKGDDQHGVTSAWHLHRSAIGHPVIVYPKTGALLTADVYQVEGEPMRVVMYCPRCANALTIPADKKRISFERAATPLGPTDAELKRIAESDFHPDMLKAFGTISIEPFQCTWETTKDRGLFGVTLCRWKAAIDNNVAKDA